MNREEAPDKLLYNSYTRVIQKNIIDLTDELKEALKSRGMELPLKLYFDVKNDFAVLVSESSDARQALLNPNEITEGAVLSSIADLDLGSYFKSINDVLKGARQLKSALVEVLSPEKLRKKLGDVIAELINDLTIDLDELLEMLKDEREGYCEKLRAELIGELLKDPKAIEDVKRVKETEVLRVAEKDRIAYHMVRLLRDRGLRFVKLGIKVSKPLLFAVRGCYAVAIEEKAFATSIASIYGETRESVVRNLKNVMWELAEDITPGKLNPPGLLLFRNGVLDLKTLTFKPVESVKGYILTNMIDCHFDTSFLGRIKQIDLSYWENEIPGFLGLLRSLFPDQENFNRALEMLGALLIPSVVRKIFIVHGDPKIGKSTLITILLRCFKEHFASVDLTKILDKFDYDLMGKLANLTTEAVGVKIGWRMIAKLNRLTGDPEMTFEEKYRPRIRGISMLKIVVVTHELPLQKEFDRALLDRLYLIKAKGKVVQDEKAIERMVDEIIQREMKGIVHFVIWCMTQVYDPATGRLTFKHDLSIDEKRELLIREANPVYMWIEECCVREGYTPRKELYKRYEEWAKREGKIVFGKNEFYDILRKLGFVEVIRQGKRCFKGIMLKTEEMKKTMEDYVEPQPTIN